MNKTIKTFLILSFITATCWAYLLGDYMGTRLSAGFHSVSSITGGGGWSPGRAPTSSSSSGSHAFGNLFGDSGGSSGDITTQSNSGTGGKAGTGTPTINITRDGIILEYKNGVKTMVKQNAGEGFVEAVTRTIGNNSATINNVVAGVIAQNQGENKFSALTQADADNLIAEYGDDFEALMTGNLTPEQIRTVSNKIVKGISEKFDVSLNEAEAILVEANNIMVEEGVSGSLFQRLNGLSINDPILVKAKDKMLLRKAIAEALPETSASIQQSPKWWSDVWGGNPPTVMPSSGDWGTSMNEAVKSAELSSIGGMTNPVMQARKSYLVGSCPGESYIAEGGYNESEDWLSTSDGWQPGAYIGEGNFMGNTTTNVTGDSNFETSASIQQSPKWWSDVWGGNPPTVMPSSGDWGTSMNEAIKSAEIAVGGTMTPVKQARQSFLAGSCPGEPYIAEGGYVGSEDWLSMSTGWQPGAYIGGGTHMGSVEGIVEIPGATLESATYWVSNDPIPAYFAKEKEEIIQTKAEEFNNEVGTNISEEMMVLALKMAIVDKKLVVTDENVREVINSITLAEVEYYISMINKVAKKYNLTPSEAVSVLKAHIADQRASNPNYKLSQENDIIGSIEANKNTSRLLEIIQEAKTKGIPATDIDLNRDGEINLIDSAILMSFWGENSSGQNSDINKDGNTNLTDYSIMMSYWNYAFK